MNKVFNSNISGTLHLNLQIETEIGLNTKPRVKRVICDLLDIFFFAFRHNF